MHDVAIGAAEVIQDEHSESDSEREAPRLPTGETPVTPGNIKTEPDRKLFINAPFGERKSYPLRITNIGYFPIAWAFKSTNIPRLSAEPGTGVLDPNEQQTIFVTCERFIYHTEDSNRRDRITLEWRLASTTETMAPNWFLGDGTLRRNTLSIEYNP